ncbi:MAG: hypothetical protein ACWA45_05100 [Flavobacteriales bacterium]
MKLVIVTAVEQFHEDIIKLFKKAEIKNFSESDIEGFKKAPALLSSSNWFASELSGTESIMLFSFTEKEKIDHLFTLLEAYNEQMESNNPIKAVVLPIEKSI